MELQAGSRGTWRWQLSSGRHERQHKTLHERVLQLLLLLLQPKGLHRWLLSMLQGLRGVSRGVRNRVARCPRRQRGGCISHPAWCGQPGRHMRQSVAQCLQPAGSGVR